MTDQPKRNEDEHLTMPPSPGESESPSDVADIHLIPHPGEDQNSPPPRIVPPMLPASEEASANDVDPPSAEVQPEVAVATETLANMFETINDLNQEPQASAPFLSLHAMEITALPVNMNVAAATPDGQRPASPPAAAPPARNSLNLLLLTWASLATITAIYLWWTRPEFPSNLDTIPDDDALKAVLKTKQSISPLSALDDQLVVRLNQTRRLGNIEVTPLGVEYRKVRVMTPDDEVAYEPTVLALRLRVKNVGGETAFAPLDHSFTSLRDRSTTPRGRNAIKIGGKIVFEDGYTYTFAHPIADVQSIDKRILPLSIEYSKNERVAEQNFPVLTPNESAEVVVLSQEEALPKLQGPMLWRVKLRKGRTTKGTGAAVVIGVPFTKSDVAMIAKAPENRVEG